MWLFQHIMKNPEKPALAYRMCVSKDVDAQKEGKLTAYCKMVKQFLATDDIENLLPGAGAMITNFRQPKYMSTVK